MRYLITFAYDGTLFSGYQKQRGLRTVQEEIEKALYQINDHQKTIIHSSGRTDKGVHAAHAKAHFDLEVSITPSKLTRALNRYLPSDIAVQDSSVVEEDFHARYMVKEKEYRYYISLGAYQPILRNYVYQRNYPLDISLMEKAIKFFEGTHDFRSFVSENRDKENCVRTIYKANIEYDENRKIVCFIFRGNGFLKYQVRNMVGYLIQVGEKKVSFDSVKDALEKKDRSQGFKTAPSVGLYLIDVKY